MPYSEELDASITRVVARWPNITRKKMFGGTCHLMNGNMMCGVHRDSLVLRLGEEQAKAALEAPHTKPFDITGKVMKGWVMVDEKGYQGDGLAAWLKKARGFVKTLPPK